MALIEKVLDGVQGALRVNPNTLSGSVDIIIVKHRDGTLKSTPFHVRFGKNQVIRRSRERLPIYISVNDTVAPFNMVMGDGGVAYFEVPVDDTSNQVPLGDLKNPVPSPSTSPPLTGSDPGSPLSSPTLKRRRKKSGDASGAAVGQQKPNVLQPTENMIPLAQAIGQYIRERDEDESAGKREGDDFSDDSDDTNAEDEYETEDKADEDFEWKWGELPMRVGSAEPPSAASSSSGPEPAEESKVTLCKSTGFVSHIVTPIADEQDPSETKDFDAEISLCAHLLGKGYESETDPEAVNRNVSIFKQHVVSFEEYCSDPQLIRDPRIAVMLDGKIYGGEHGLELLVSVAVFHRNPAHLVQRRELSSPSDVAQGSLMTSEQQQELQEEYMLSEELARARQSWAAWLWAWTKWLVLCPVKISQSLFVAPTAATAAKKKEQRKISPSYYSGPRCYRKSLRPTEGQLRMLNFHDGANKITFFIKTKNGQLKTVRSSLYVVDEDAKIIISDIDGTITKSDALGHIFNFIGKDWSQSGVAQLYTRIHDNGYLILYLTSRAIGQAQATRNYISSVRQSHNAYFGTYTLPPGPVFMSPFRLLNAIDKELLRRIPHEFKMACLADIMSLFPLRAKPFYAGFGNKDTDVKSYDFVGVDSSRIFIVNPRGIVHTGIHSPEATYISLNDTVDSIFPPIHSTKED